jgi:hypothetical protein
MKATRSEKPALVRLLEWQIDEEFERAGSRQMDATGEASVLMLRIDEG